MTIAHKSFRLGPMLRGVRDLSGDRVRLLPLMVATAMLAFLCEASAIYLIFPLLEVLGGNDLATARVGPAGWLSQAVARVPEDRRVSLIVAAIVGLIGLKALIAFLSNILFAGVTQQIGDDIRRKCFGFILALSPLYLQSRPSGAMVNTLAGQTWVVSEGLGQVAGLLTHASAVLVFLTLLLTVSWTATVFVCLGVLIAGLVAHFVNRIVTRLGRKAVQVNDDLTSQMLEGLSGHTTLRLFNAESPARAAFARASDRSRRTLYRLSIATSVPPLLLDALFAAVVGLVLVFLYLKSVGEVVVLIALLLRMQPHAIALIHTRTVLAGLAGAVENLMDLSRAAGATKEPAGLPPAPPVTRDIRFAKVSFGYPLSNSSEGPAQTALHEVSFDIPTGKITALVGHSGAGKSTVAMLLCRLATPAKGRILVDGADLSRFDAASWRSRCAVVPQDVYLFNTTIRQNIALGRPNASQKEIREAAILAHADIFIRDLAKGYDTMVGDRGEGLSGGQRQRIALARAILRRPEILILDEATNALDPRSEQLVAGALHLSDGSRTTLVIAHRLSTVRRADHVVVLDGGRVVETGSPAGLSAKLGAFADLFRHELEAV